MDKVIEIQREKRFVKLYTAGGECFTFAPALWRISPVQKEGAEFEPEELKQWLLTQQYPYALPYAVQLLAKQPRSVEEIRRKLLLRHNSPETVEMVLYKLEKERLTDDAAFAEQYAESHRRRGYGPERIRRGLMEKGVAKEIAERVLAEEPDDEQEDAAFQVGCKLMSHYRNEENPQKRYAKFMGAMARRGYSYEESRKVLALMKESFAEEE